MNIKVFKRILAETLNDVSASTYKTGINFKLCYSTQFVGYFIGYSLVEMCEHSGCPKVTPRFLCFDTEGVRTSCDPHFDSITDDIAYYNTMIQTEFWEQQIDIKQTLDAITELRTKQIQAGS